MNVKNARLGKIIMHQASLGLNHYLKTSSPHVDSLIIIIIIIIIMNVFLFFQYPVRPSGMPYDDFQHLVARVKPKQKMVNVVFTVYVSFLMCRAQFHGSAYRKYRIGAYGSRGFCAYGKRISRVGVKFALLRVRTARY